MTQLTAQQAAALSLGRYWGSADQVALTEHPEGDATARFAWADGAALTTYYPTHRDARQAIARLGFASSRAAAAEVAP